MYTNFIEIKSILFNDIKILTIQTSEPEQPKRMITATTNMKQYPGKVLKIENNIANVSLSDKFFCQGRVFGDLSEDDDCWAMEHLKLFDDSHVNELAYMEFIITKNPSLVGDQNFVKLEFKNMDVYLDCYDASYRFIKK